MNKTGYGGPLPSCAAGVHGVSSAAAVIGRSGPKSHMPAPVRHTYVRSAPPLATSPPLHMRCVTCCAFINPSFCIHSLYYMCCRISQSGTHTPVSSAISTAHCMQVQSVCRQIDAAVPLVSKAKQRRVADHHHDGCSLRIFMLVLCRCG